MAIHKIIDVITCYRPGDSGIDYILVPLDFLPTGPIVGLSINVGPPDGQPIKVTVSGTRDHGPTTSVLVEDWPDGYLPPKIGWSLSLPTISSPAS